jgi:carbon storage regulator CsrA
MLVLSRKLGEKILVPQCQLTVTVLDIASSRVRLGVSAPPGIRVHREEMQKRLATESSIAPGETLMAARILIADSDRFLVARYRRHLSELGVSVSTARSGLECIQRLRDAVPDVLVLDPALQWGGGDGVLAVLHEEPALRPAVVMILAQSRNRSFLYRLSRFRVDDYQTKPLTPDRLATRICTLLLSARDRAVLPR